MRKDQSEGGEDLTSLLGSRRPTALRLSHRRGLGASDARSVEKAVTEVVAEYPGPQLVPLTTLGARASKVCAAVPPQRRPCLLSGRGARRSSSPFRGRGVSFREPA